MKKHPLSIHILMAAVSVFAITLLMTFHSVSASRPTQNAPAGNPTFPPGVQGPQGTQGLQGTTGGQGPVGDTGAIGAQGAIGTASCNWNGGLWISHGWDGACAWYVGVRIGCSGNTVTSFTNYYYTGGGACGYMCYGGGACTTPS